MNLWDILILLLIVLCAVFSLFRAQKRKESGKSCCGCSCGDACTLCREKQNRSVGCRRSTTALAPCSCSCPGWSVGLNCKPEFPAP